MKQYATFGNLGKTITNNEPQHTQYKNHTMGDQEKFVIEIQSEDHKVSLIKSNVMVVINLYTNRFAPCISLKPLFKKLALEMTIPRECIFCEENAELRLQSQKGKLDMSITPCVQIFIDGMFIDQVIGDDINNIRSHVFKIFNKTFLNSSSNLSLSM